MSSVYVYIEYSADKLVWSSVPDEKSKYARAKTKLIGWMEALIISINPLIAKIIKEHEIKEAERLQSDFPKICLN